jgi:trehalose 6-phosphate synthase
LCTTRRVGIVDELQGKALLVIASNRAVADLRPGAGGVFVHGSGSGGLVNVLGPALAGTDGVWVATALSDGDRALAGRRTLVALAEGPVALHLLDLPPSEYEAYYRRISTELLWFLQHQLVELLHDGPDLLAAWDSYRRVNQAFAEACGNLAARGGRVLVEDYHLALAPRWLRQARPDVAIAHHWMIPWAEPDTFARLPSAIARELVDGLLGADMACFLVRRWADAFLTSCAALGYEVDRAASAVIDRDGRRVAVRWFPVGVDAERLADRAAQPDVTRHVEQLRGIVGARRLVVRVDRMEPSKNIVRGLEAFGLLLERSPALHGRLVHFVLAYGSRAELPAYRDHATRVIATARAINERFGTSAWQPIVLETENDFARGLAAMAIADVLVVNPLRDGMNLVAKEGPIVSRRALGLVLSRDAGAAEALGSDAWVVDPLDTAALAQAIAAALEAPEADRAAKIARLRAHAGALPPARWLSESLAELARIVG